jgi:hypothetical protein
LLCANLWREEKRTFNFRKNPFAISVGASENAGVMQPPTPPDKDKEKASPPTRMAITEPNFSGTPQPIGEFTVRADFPQCTRGVYVDIRGFAGVVVDIVNQSIKVRSPDGITQSFNANRLKTLYAPRPLEPSP